MGPKALSVKDSHTYSSRRDRFFELILDCEKERSAVTLGKLSKICRRRE